MADGVLPCVEPRSNPQAWLACRRTDTCQCWTPVVIGNGEANYSNWPALTYDVCSEDQGTCAINSARILIGIIYGTGLIATMPRSLRLLPQASDHNEYRGW